MNKIFAVAIIALFSLSALANITLERRVDGALGENTHAEMVVEIIKKNPSLAKAYTDQMKSAFDFLDPERRDAAAHIDGLGTYSLSKWTPTSAGRIGWSPEGFCNNETEDTVQASGRFIVGFDTSYKREQTYGFWAIFDYGSETCENFADETVGTLRDRTKLTFVRWVKAEEVYNILYPEPQGD